VDDDSTLTDNQRAAVGMIDAYLDVFKAMVADPANADYGALLSVAVNPAYDEGALKVSNLATNQTRITGWVIPAGRDVGAEAVVDGRTQITVTQCDQDDPTAMVITPSEEHPPTGEPRILYEYVVQWQDDVQDWRVAQVTRLGTSC
jgi:hypothetical protein